MSSPQSESSEGTPLEVPSALLHELRTPLNHIIGFSELLMEQAPDHQDPQLARDLEKIHAAGRRLLSLINDRFHSDRFADPRTATAAGENGSSAADALALSDGYDVDAAAPGSVLVVDDIEANRDVLCRSLKRQGYTVASCQSGKRALAMLDSGTYDVVLLDVMMPEMDGYEVLQRLKENPSLSHIPVIMISALGEMDSVVRCIALGAEDYLPKPFEPTLLKARIGACLQKKRAHDREAQLAADLHAQNNEMSRWREAQEADLAVARTTQQAIVTSPLPTVDRWEVETVYTPLIQVGGDVYGWRQLDNGSALFWLADATGHGVAAALFTTLVSLLFHQASAQFATVAEILARVNAEFYSVLRGRSLMTACCAIIKPDGRLAFAGAGHPALLIRRSDGTVETLPSQTTMIGIYPTVQTEETVATLAAGDAALLYTDGLYSSRAKDGERLTAESLTELFARNGGEANSLPRLIEQLSAEAGEQAFDDDVSAIALRRV